MKQLVGNVTKQVMAHHGYRLDQNNVKTPNGAPFTRASRYVRANEVTYRVFHDPANPRSLVLTKSKASPLPEWSYWKGEGRVRLCVGLGLPNVRQATEEMMRTGHVRHAR